LFLTVIPLFPLLIRVSSCFSYKTHVGTEIALHNDSLPILRTEPMSHILFTHKLSCPQCQSSSVRRSRRHTVLDYGLRWLSFYSFRCRDCYQRFRVWCGGRFAMTIKRNSAGHTSPLIKLP